MIIGVFGEKTRVFCAAFDISLLRAFDISRFRNFDISTRFGALFLSLNAEFLELFFGDRSRRLSHKAGRARRFRECDDIADRVGIVEKHHQPVKSECQAAVRRSTEFESFDEVSEILLRLFVADPQEFENLFLLVGVVDPYAAAARFFLNFEIWEIKRVLWINLLVNTPWKRDNIFYMRHTKEPSY